jgi:hypothetical protein
VQDGRARCRNEHDKCSNHKRNGWAHAPAPTVVLLKINVNDKWWLRFHSAGINQQERTLARAQQLE